MDSASDLLQNIARIRLNRARRELVVPKEIADSDCAWHMLVELAFAEAQGDRLSISGACIMSRHPPTTALRWVKRLYESGLTVRTASS
ncbi:MAG: MarR family transcriptional regulator, partial [Sphingobium limneticum]